MFPRKFNNFHYEAWPNSTPLRLFLTRNVHVFCGFRCPKCARIPSHFEPFSKFVPCVWIGLVWASSWSWINLHSCAFLSHVVIWNSSMLLPGMSREGSILAENQVHWIGFIGDRFQWRVRRCLDTCPDGHWHAMKPGCWRSSPNKTTHETQLISILLWICL